MSEFKPVSLSGLSEDYYKNNPSYKKPSTPNINSILRANPRPCKYGAPMGSSNYFDPAENTKCYLQKIKFVNGAYAPDGTYWGLPENLYCAFNETQRVYVRAKTRLLAVCQLVEQFPAIQFHRV